jgi:type II secretory pathway pseudopilin PulG
MRAFDLVHKGDEHGFSLLEMLVALGILMAVFGFVATGTMQLQHRANMEASKVDLTQEARSFLDQVSRDIRQTGFPSVRTVDPAMAAANPNSFAVGLIDVEPGKLVMEGDMDGSGQVSDVTVELIPAGGPCPCVLRRGSVTKAAAALGGAPAYYTEVTNVMNSNVFTAYFYDGTVVPLPALPADLPNIKNIGLTLNVQTTYADPIDHAPATITMASKVKINN